MGFEEKDIILDLMACSYHATQGTETSANAFDNLMAARDIRDYYLNTSSVQYARYAYPEVETRYYFQYQDLDNCYNPAGLDFRNSTTWCMQEEGRKDAQNALTIGQDQILESLDKWTESEELQEEHPDMVSYLRATFGL